VSHSQTVSSTGVLERPRQHGNEPAPTTSIPVPTEQRIAVAETDESVEVGGDRSFRTPALIVLATVAIYEGYRWLGVVPPRHTGLSALASSHTVIVSLAVVLALAGHALTHQRSTRRRWRCGTAVTWAGATVTGAAATLVTLGGRPPAYTLGVAYLLLAAAALSAATMSGRPSQGGSPHPVDPSGRCGVRSSTPSGPWDQPTSTPSAWGRRNDSG